MKKQKIKIEKCQLWNLFLICTLVLFGCQNEELIISEETTSISNLKKANKNNVTVSSDGFNFTAPESIPSGWTTFNYVNKSDHPHFFVLERMPDGYDVTNSINEVVPAFQEGMYYIMDGDWGNALAAFGTLPAWYFNVVIVGGPGIVSAGESAETTVNLEPGTYVIECYVKLPDGTFHTSLGMIDQIQVTNVPNNNVAPKANIDINISSTNGIEIVDEIKPGLRTFAVHFQDQIVHEHFLGHDVHLVKLDESADLDALNNWMNWSAPSGLAGHGIDGVTFIGGTQEAPAGHTTYFTALLTPGNYALIAEVPNADAKGMLQTFTIPDNN
jgi:hypothetical protein